MVNSQRSNKVKKKKKKGPFDPSTYVFTFGRYKGVKITDMVSDEQLRYCEWVYKAMVGNNQSLSHKFKAVLWYLNSIKQNKVGNIK